MQHFTTDEIRALSAEQNGWPAIPDGVPQHILHGICEQRSRILAGRKVTPAQARLASAEAESLRDQLKAVALF
jgi:hypothetical protein